MAGLESGFVFSGVALRGFCSGELRIIGGTYALCVVYFLIWLYGVVAENPGHMESEWVVLVSEGRSFFNPSMGSYLTTLSLKLQTVFFHSKWMRSSESLHVIESRSELPGNHTHTVLWGRVRRSQGEVLAQSDLNNRSGTHCIVNAKHTSGTSISPPYHQLARNDLYKYDNQKTPAALPPLQTGKIPQ